MAQARAPVTGLVARFQRRTGGAGKHPGVSLTLNVEEAVWLDERKRDGSDWIAAGTVLDGLP